MFYLAYYEVNFTKVLKLVYKSSIQYYKGFNF